MTNQRFSELGLAETLQRALAEREHTTPTPIQARAIPEVMAGRDVLAIAQTGTGKTAAFALPILHRLAGTNSGGRGRAPRALVLAPTRELAIQIANEFSAYGTHLQLRLAVIYGGVGQRPQVDTLARGVDILVATPGRLLDLMGQRRVDLHRVEHLVLDEADRMLDMGFVRDVRRILVALPTPRQSLLFSATMPRDVARLAGDFLRDPVRVAVMPQATPVDERAFEDRRGRRSGGRGGRGTGGRGRRTRGGERPALDPPIECLQVGAQTPQVLRLLLHGRAHPRHHEPLPVDHVHRDEQRHQDRPNRREQEEVLESEPFVHGRRSLSGKCVVPETPGWRAERRAGGTDQRPGSRCLPVPLLASSVAPPFVAELLCLQTRRCNDPSCVARHDTMDSGIGAPGGTRTPDTQVRSLVLYPTELRAHGTAERGTLPDSAIEV